MYLPPSSNEEFEEEVNTLPKESSPYLPRLFESHSRPDVVLKIIYRKLRGVYE
jgi:hypothetical protein